MATAKKPTTAATKVAKAGLEAAIFVSAHKKGFEEFLLPGVLKIGMQQFPLNRFASRPSPLSPWQLRCIVRRRDRSASALSASNRVGRRSLSSSHDRSCRTCCNDWDAEQRECRFCE
jgi:hypothetical protein